MLNLITKWLSGAMGDQRDERIPEQEEVFPPDGIIAIPELPGEFGNPYGEMSSTCEVLVAPGQQVYGGQALAVIDTPNVTLEIPSPCSGVVKELFISNGAAVSGGENLASIERAP